MEFEDLAREVLEIDNMILKLLSDKRKLGMHVMDIDNRIDTYTDHRDSIVAMIDSKNVHWLHKNESDLSGKFNEEIFLENDKMDNKFNKK